ncbi:MAG: cytochrome P450 [Pseudomonadota bacterium]
MNTLAAPVVNLSAERPLNLMDKHFHQNKWAYYQYLRDHLPVHPAKIAVAKIIVVARYDDCMNLVKDPRFGRNRGRIMGKGESPLPFPVPKNIRALAQSMILEDDPEHRRLRNMVQKAFAPKNINALGDDIEALAHRLLDELIPQQTFDLQQAYALQIPVKVIAGIMGLNDEHMVKFQQSLRVLSEGLSGWNVMRTLLWDIRRSANFMREVIEEKRRNPGDDILSNLIQPGEDGDCLSEDELLSMIFLLIIAGYETTVNLVTNGVHALLTHPDQLARLRAEPELVGSAVEEMLRFCGPVHGTKMNYAREDLEIGGVEISKGTGMMPLLGSANRDERFFAQPEIFDIARSDNKHLSFSQGNHFCLGAFLARMETRIAIKVLIERLPDLRLAIPGDDVEILARPGWHRLGGLPVRV